MRDFAIFSESFFSIFTRWVNNSIRSSHRGIILSIVAVREIRRFFRIVVGTRFFHWMHEFAESKTRPKRGELSLLYSISTPYNINYLGKMPFFRLKPFHSQAPYIIRTPRLYQRILMIARVWSLPVRWVLEPEMLTFFTQNAWIFLWKCFWVFLWKYFWVFLWKYVWVFLWKCFWDIFPKHLSLKVWFEVLWKNCCVLWETYSK